MKKAMAFIVNLFRREMILREDRCQYCDRFIGLYLMAREGKFFKGVCQQCRDNFIEGRTEETYYETGKWPKE